MTTKPIAARLLRYIVDQVREQDAVPTRTKVAKLLYLVDVEYYRRCGRTLSGLSWRFLHYGPYAVEIEPLLQNLDLDEEEVTTKKGHKAFTYRAQQPESMDDILPPSDQRLVDRIIERWALENLYRLLDHVYFETEPMKGVVRGHLLDFSNIVRTPTVVEKVPEARLPQRTISNLQKRFKELFEGRALSVRHYTPPPYDDIYFQAIERMNSGEAGLSYFRFAKSLEIGEESEESIAKQID